MTRDTAERAREQLATWMIEHSFSTGHGDTFEDLLKELDWQVKELRGARLEEAKKLAQRITDYLSIGGLFNPEMAKHDRVRDLLIECRAALTQALQVEEKEGT